MISSFFFGIFLVLLTHDIYDLVSHVIIFFFLSQVRQDKRYNKINKWIKHFSFRSN